MAAGVLQATLIDDSCKFHPSFGIGDTGSASGYNNVGSASAYTLQASDKIVVTTNPLNTTINIDPDSLTEGQQITIIKRTNSTGGQQTVLDAGSNQLFISGSGGSTGTYTFGNANDSVLLTR